MKRLSYSLSILFALISLQIANAAQGDLAPFNFMPDPGFQNWTPQNPLFNSDVPYGGQNDFGSYMVVDNMTEKNVNYVPCSYSEKMIVLDGLPIASNDPRDRFLLIEFEIDVVPQREYEFSFNYMNPDVSWPDYLPEISVELDGIELMAPTLVLNRDENCDFYTFSTQNPIQSGNRITMTISIYNHSMFRYPVSGGINDNSIRGNDIALWGFEMYQYCEMTDNDLQTYQVCEGEEVPPIEKILTDADRGATINWDFEVGGQFTGPQITGYIPTDNETVYVEIEDGIGCTEYDTFNINVFKFPANIEIGSNLAAPRLCPCETAQLEVPDNLPQGNFAYEWSASDPDVNSLLQGTDQTILDIDTPSEYILTITEENLGCTKELRYTVGAIEGGVQVSIDDVQADIGDSTKVVISSIVSQEFIDCGFQEITAELHYDYTVLHNSELPYNVIDNRTASYPITIPNNGELEIPFKVLLGLSRLSDISLFNFQVECGDYDDFVTIQEGELEVFGICDQPSQRLIDPNTAFNLSNIHIIGNTLFAKVELQERSQHTVMLYDISGAAVTTETFSGQIGESTLLSLDIGQLASQNFYMNISTPAESYTLMLSR